jgi:hypothetical protein
MNALSPLSQHPPNFCRRARGIGKIFEDLCTDNQIELFIGKRKRLGDCRHIHQRSQLRVDRYVTLDSRAQQRTVGLQPATNIKNSKATSRQAYDPLFHNALALPQNQPARVSK